MALKVMEGQLDFLGILNEYKDDTGATVRVREPNAEAIKVKAPKASAGAVSVKMSEPELKQLKIDFDSQAEVKPEVKTFENKKPVKESEIIARTEIKKESEKEEKAEIIKEPLNKEKPLNNEGKELKFKQCKKCWCLDCKHNGANEGVPRDMGGVKMPCPACEACESSDNPEICPIGDYKEGCKLRAIEEGIFVPEKVE